MQIANSKLMQARRCSKEGENQAPQADACMINPDMPQNNAAPIQSDGTIASMALDSELRPPTLFKLPSSDLKVEIPIRKKVAIVELPNSVSKEALSISYQKSDSTAAEDEIGPEEWKRCHKVSITALHSSFTNKYSVKAELFDSNNQSIGTLETGLYHNPGNYCFFCLDYVPETLKVRKGFKISCVAPYCSCCPKTVYDYIPGSKQAPKILGKIKSFFCSNKVEIYNAQGELVYSLKDKNNCMRNCRFLVETPFLPLCIPYKLAICCCLDVLWSKNPKEIKLYDHKTKTEVPIGSITNYSERSNEWQEVIRNGEKVNQYKGEEIFMCKNFEVNLPAEADEAAKKLIIGTLIAEIPSTIDRCAC